MSMLKILCYVKQLCSYFLSLIAFPLTCISCGKQCYGISLCNDCQNDFLNTIVSKEYRCLCCGVQLISEQELCLECRLDESNDSARVNAIQKSVILQDLVSVFPIHHYILWKKELLFAWKIAGNRSLTPFFAKIVYSVLNTYYKGIPLVPVPPRKGKIKEKGWDQIDDLCTFLQKAYGLPVIQALERLSNLEQKKRNREERLYRSEKNYSLHKDHRQLPHSVVIIDDVMTTGSTLQSCAQALKEGGVEHIHAVTLFYV